MRVVFTLLASISTLMLATTSASAVELLISGDFETPGGVGDIPGWVLEEFVTGDVGAEVNSAALTGGEDVRLFLRPFEAGGPLTPSQGNFDSDGLPAGEVDGQDFLTWQRNNGLTGTALPEQGDANGDMNVDGDDLGIWQSNYARNNVGRFINARLTQTVPAAPGVEYNFQGTSTFEENYAGFVTTLDAESPNGAIASPTQTNFRMEFLDSGGAVIGSSSLDLRSEQVFPGFPVVHSPITATSPAGTTDVRVVAEALDMVWNGNAANEGLNQSAFFNDFSLFTTIDSSTELLNNGNLDLGPPDALDFWDQSIDPEGCCNATEENPFGEVLRTPIAPWANNTPGGSRGVWFSAFWGGSVNNFDPNPVDGIMSQTVEAVAGGTYSFSGWSRFEGNYSGGVDTIANDAEAVFAGQPSPTETEIVLEFLDVNQNVLDTHTIDVKEDRELQICGGTSACANDGAWYEHTLEDIVAPANTRFARLTGQFIDGVFNTNPQQSAFFDDFSLDGPAVGSFIAPSLAVPEPASLGYVGLGMMWMLSVKRRRG